jgi:hypothetical protein
VRGRVSHNLNFASICCAPFMSAVRPSKRHPMPRRSNAFQRLAFLIQRSVAPDWTVEESAMLPDILTGKLREVDVIAKRLVAGHEMVLSIECRDHKRPADVSWVESMHTKHQHLATSKLVLWSNSGFTHEAISKSKLLKIDAVSQAQATRPKWARLARSLVNGTLLHVSHTLNAFVDLTLPGGALRRFTDVSDWLFYNGEGKVVGSIEALIHQIRHGSFVPTIILDNAPNGQGDFYIELEPSEPWFAEVPFYGRCVTNRIGVGMKTFGERALLSTASAGRNGGVVTLVSAPLLLGNFSALIEERENTKGANSA